MENIEAQRISKEYAIKKAPAENGMYDMDERYKAYVCKMLEQGWICVLGCNFTEKEVAYQLAVWGID